MNIAYKFEFRPILCKMVFIDRRHFYRPQGKVMFSGASTSHSVHNWPHGYSVTVHPCYVAFGTHPTGMLSCSLIL